MLSNLYESGKAFFSQAGMLIGTGVALVLCWVYWPSLVTLTARWGADSDYSHGFLVPLFSLYLLWTRRKELLSDSPRSSWWGMPLLVLGLCLRLAGVYLYFDWLQAVSFLPCLAGLCVLARGWSALRSSWVAIAFLLFMVPLPFRFETALAHPLQRVATLVSTYLVQTLGFAAFSEGNIIRLGQIRIGVNEACSGLSMLVVFFALSTAVAILTRRPRLDKILIFVSAVPIALTANIVRITVTAILYKTAGKDLADLVFHDLAGWLMMPLALALLWSELRVLSWVLIPRPTKHPISAGLMVRDAKPAKTRRKTSRLRVGRARPKSDDGRAQGVKFRER